MSHISTSGILLRRVDYGEYDLIATFLTRDYGRLSAVAKYARKSRRRFPGILELFSELDFVGVLPKRGGMPVIQEAVLARPFAGIRGSLGRTAYASYWSELLLGWLEEGKSQRGLYRLLRHSLQGLDEGRNPPEESIIFQLFFLKLSGLSPDFTRCSLCRKPLEELSGEKFGFDLEKGGLVCKRCLAGTSPFYRLSRGTVKQLLWIQSSSLANVGRLKFTESAVKESLCLLEAFVPYHTGRQPKSLKFLRQIIGISSEQ